MCHRKDKMEQDVIHVSIYNVVVGGNDKNEHQVRGAYFFTITLFASFYKVWEIVGRAPISGITF